MSRLPPGLEGVIATTAPLTERFTAAGHRFFLVGGVVRDHLLDRRREDADLDATTAARPEQIKKIVAPIAEAVWTQGERFGTIGCTVAGQPYEITTHRAEAYDHASRKPTVSFGDDIGDDLARRDFTVNAMAVDAATGELVDPYGGREDLANRVLRTPLDPEVSFSEDPLRMLRAARFHAGYDLTPAPELEAAITALVDRIEIVSVERIRDELQKLLLLDDPGPGLALLARTGVLAVVVPPLARIDEASARELGRLVGAVAREPGRRWAVLLHEPISQGELQPPDLRAMKFSNRLGQDVFQWWTLVALGLDPGAAYSTVDGSARNVALRTHQRGLRPEDELDFVRDLRVASGGPTDDLDALTATIDRLRAAEPDFDDPTPVLGGDEVADELGVEPGPVIGEALEMLWMHRMQFGPLTKAQAVEVLRDWWAARETGSG